MSKPVAFTFEGRVIKARPGLSVAAALTEAGIRAFKTTKSGAERGMFCGMGVCQDCLVEINGRSNQRACMTRVEPHLAIRRQPALARLAAAAGPDTTKPAVRLSPDVLVIGGGAGGLSAAIAAAQAGAATLVLDERKVEGGQYFKQLSGEVDAVPLDQQQRDGADLIARCQQAGAEILHGVEVWGAFDGLQIHADRAGEAILVKPKALIVATGAYERPIMVPGWTSPGVMTTGAAQTLWRSYRTLPGKRVAIVGSGPLNFQVALELQAGGAEVCVVAESAPAPWFRPALSARLMAADPRLAMNGAKMVRHLMTGPGDLLFSANLEKIETTEQGLTASITRSNGRVSDYQVDVVCMNGGFQPQNEILRLLGAEMVYDATMDQLRPHRSEWCETSVPNLYAIGDCCGLGGAPAAQIEGRIAGAAAARAVVESPTSASTATDHVSSGDRSSLARHRTFQDVLWQLHQPSLPALDSLTPDTLVCRCEEVSRTDIDQALAGHATEIGSVKRATRLGMGPCQGRYCMPAVASYLARKRGELVDDFAFFAPRVPIKPVPIASIVAIDEDDE